MLVKRILSNEIYVGTLIQHKSGTPNHKIKKRVEYDRDEWIVIENNHEPIICRSDFDTVQNLMLRDVRTAPKQEKVHLFSGFVFCGDCKHTMVRKTVPSGGRKYHYLVCSTNKAGKGCSPHTFSEDKLKAIVFRVVNDHNGKKEKTVFTAGAGAGTGQRHAAVRLGDGHLRPTLG